MRGCKNVSMMVLNCNRKQIKMKLVMQLFVTENVTESV